MPAFVLLFDACVRSTPEVDTVDPDPTVDTGEEEGAVPPPPPVAETFRYAPPAVDVLFVVDNSSSMNGKNRDFADAVEAAVASWLRLGIDFQAGVVDIDANDWLGELEEYDGARWVDETWPDAVEALGELVTGVPDYTSDEAGRRAVSLALRYTADGQPNAGFLREGSELDIIVHSDEDDGSEDDPNHDDLVAYLRSLRPDPRLLRFHAISYGTDYASLAEELGGVTQDVADTPYEPALDAATARIHRTDVFALSERARPATITVSVGGLPLDAAAYSFDAITNAVDLGGVPLVEGDEVLVSYVPLGR